MGCLLSHALQLATCCRCSCCRDVCSLCHSINSHYQRLSSPHLYRMCAVAPLNGPGSTFKKLTQLIADVPLAANQLQPIFWLSCDNYANWLHLKAQLLALHSSICRRPSSAPQLHCSSVSLLHSNDFSRAPFSFSPPVLGNVRRTNRPRLLSTAFHLVSQFPWKTNAASVAPRKFNYHYAILSARDSRFVRLLASPTLINLQKFTTHIGTKTIYMGALQEFYL